MHNTHIPTPDDDLFGTWADRLRSVPTLSVEEAGAVLGLGRTGAYAAAHRGDLPTIRVGRRLLVPTLGLLRMLGDEGQPAEQVAG